MAYRHDYGLIAAGAVGASLIGRLAAGRRSVGPVAGVSYRVASRIANNLRAGTAVRSMDELASARAIVFHAPANQTGALLDLVRRSSLELARRCVLVVDCGDTASAGEYFRSRDAWVATIRPCGVPGRLVVQGSAPALQAAHRLVADVGMKPLDIPPGMEDRFEAALTIAGPALTPLIEAVARMLGECGLRDPEASRMAASLFESTARSYSHSGKLSWAWHMRGPDPGRLKAQAAALDDRLRPLFGELIAAAMEGADRNPGGPDRDMRSNRSAK